MILSFHPIIVGDVNRLCAGRDADSEDEAAIRAADAVILPQGCSLSLYRMAKAGCRHRFPNYDARFAYPDKPGQIRLFRKLGTPHPDTALFADIQDYRDRCPDPAAPPFGFPVVMKFAWGGEGETVFFADDADGVTALVRRAEDWERTGQRGFLIQRHHPEGRRVLRVTVIGRTLVSYWRAQPDPAVRTTAVARGGMIDVAGDSAGQARGVAAAEAFCAATGINLAGLDLIVPEAPSAAPLFLEINYFFGRRGLGGTDAYYRILRQEIARWLRLVGPRPPEAG
jgi:ribosomal protein S6--L-glutamate ligase